MRIRCRPLIVSQKHLSPTDEAGVGPFPACTDTHTRVRGNKALVHARTQTFDVKNRLTSAHTHTHTGKHSQGGSGTQNYVDQKWPDQIFPMVNFVFSHDGHFGLEGGGGSRGGYPPLLLRCTAILILPCTQICARAGPAPPWGFTASFRNRFRPHPSAFSRGHNIPAIAVQ